MLASECASSLQMESCLKFACMSLPFVARPTPAAALRTSCFPRIVLRQRETRVLRIGRRLARLRNFKFWETESHATVLDSYRHGDAARPRERRHRPDGAETIPQGADARRIWADTFL